MVDTESTARFSRLHREHGTFRCLLRLLETQVQVLGEGRPDYWLMQEALDFLEHYPGYGHDLLETRVLEALAGHSTEVNGLFGDMRHLHQNIEARGRRLTQNLDAINLGEVVPIDDIKTAARSYIDSYRHYMAIEEQRIFPLAGEMLNPADWRYIDEVVTVSGAISHDEAMRIRYAAFGAGIAKHVGCSLYCDSQSTASLATNGGSTAQ